MHFHFNLRRNTRFMQRIENICSTFSPISFYSSPSILPSPFFLPFPLHHPSPFPLGKYTRIRVPSEASRNGQTMSDKRIKDKFYPRFLEGISPSCGNWGTEDVAPRNISRFRFAYERERERLTSMAIKWTMLTIHQFSISWNFNGIAASCANTKGSPRPS